MGKKREKEKKPVPPWEEFTAEDVASPEMLYWTQEREEQWMNTITECVQKYNMRRKGERYQCCKRLDSLFRREVQSALAAGSYMGALFVCFRLDLLLLDEDLMSPGSFPFSYYDSKDETPKAMQEGLTLEGMELRCLEQAEEILRTAPEASRNRIWRAAAWMCDCTLPSDRFRSVLMEAPWTEAQKKQLLDAAKSLDAANHPGFPGTEDGAYDPEPYCPPLDRAANQDMPKYVRTEWEERILARYGAEHRKWLEWVRRTGYPEDYQLGLRDLVLQTEWATLEDLEELRRLSEEGDWAFFLVEMREKSFWRDRWEAVERIQREVPPAEDDEDEEEEDDWDEDDLEDEDELEEEELDEDDPD